MKYLVRLNERAFNPLSKKINPAVMWEVEQAETKDSQKVIWHCHNVVIRHRDGFEEGIRFKLARELANRKMLDAKTPIVFEFFGFVTRDQDNNVMIREGRE